ncbi:MAG: hypothetical protein PUF50_03635 [Erysipelotrichaceae bacterium]|nr:hypothetical protein [Erysipelotrichaceae bacterium]
MSDEFDIVFKTEDEERGLWNLLEKACIGERASSRNSWNAPRRACVEQDVVGVNKLSGTIVFNKSGTAELSSLD